MTAERPKAVLFDLLTALIDSWALWDAIAGGAAAGRRWRAAYLRNTYRQGRYRAYEELVREAATEVSLPPGSAEVLAARYDQLRPWPEVAVVLGALREAVPLGIVTNCSERLGRIAAERTGLTFEAIVTAERAGFYKPDPRSYRLALDELRVAPEECLFVAGSAYDLSGAAAVGMEVYWHNRIGMEMPADARAPRWHEPTLHRLTKLVLG